jgi:hypothetical protein
VIVSYVFREEALEMTLGERDYMIEQVSAAASDPPLRDAIYISNQLRLMVTVRADVS